MGRNVPDAGGGGGVDGYFVSGNETTIVVTDNYTSLTLSDLSNKPTEPFVFLQTAAYKRVRIPNGASTLTREWMNLQVDGNSMPVYFEAETALTDGTRKLIACLGPGAYGAFKWNGTEWFWGGEGEIFKPVLKNSSDWIAVDNAGVHLDFCYFEDATIGPGIVNLRQDTNSPLRLEAQVVTIGVDGSAGSKGTAVTHAETNDIASAYATLYQLSNTIFVALYYETTTNHMRLNVLTRTAGTNTLTWGSTSLVFASGGGSPQYTSLTNMRGHDDRFIMAVGNSSPDSAYYPEYAYCTISGTGASAAITKNTGVTFNTTSELLYGHGGGPVEDPDTDGLFWTLGQKLHGTNTAKHVLKFTIVGTTPTLGDRWRTPDHTVWTTSYERLQCDMLDGHLWYNVDASTHIFFKPNGSGVPVATGGISALSHYTLFGRFSWYDKYTYGYSLYGGVIASLFHIGSGSRAERVPLSSIEGSAGSANSNNNTYNSTAYVQESHNDKTMQNAGALSNGHPLPDGDAVYLTYNGAFGAVICTNKAVQCHWGIENKSLMVRINYDATDSVNFLIDVWEIPTATRYGRVG